MNRLKLFLIVLPLLFACTQEEKEVLVESISLNPSSVELEIGKTLQLTATVSPSTATAKDLTWSSSMSSVASVNSSGLVTAISDGTTTITASADGKTGSCQIEVLAPLKGITLSTTTLGLVVGQEETLIATLIPDIKRTVSVGI